MTLVNVVSFSEELRLFRYENIGNEPFKKASYSMNAGFPKISKMKRPVNNLQNGPKSSYSTAIVH